LERIRGLLLLSTRKDRQHAERLVGRLNVVAASVEQRVSSLSGGNQQKVVISKALSANSTILLLDDPTIGVDVESKQEILRIVRSFASEGRNAAVFVSSELEMLSEICDRVIVLRQGRVVGELDRSRGDDLSESHLLSLV
jgi:ABC-type sugar transport system ATPase subunit